MIWILAGVALIAILLLLSGFFSGSEMAFVSVNRALVRRKANNGNENAQILDKLLEEPNKVISSIVVGNNLVNIFASVIAGSITTFFFGNIGIGIATALMTLLIVVFSEVTPKSLGIRNEEFLLKIAKPLELVTKIFSPLSVFLVHLSETLTRLVGKRTKKARVTEEGIKAMVELGAEEGAIEEDEKEKVSEMLDFDDTRVKEVVIPKGKMVAFKETDSIQKVIDKSMETGFSRFPVYRENIDKITGMVHVKDSFRVDDYSLPVKKIKRKIPKVSPQVMINDVLEEMKKRKTHIAIVRSRNKKTLGIVTMEDLIEEIFGEIVDEHDE